MAHLVTRTVASSCAKPPSRSSISFIQTPRSQRTTAPAIRVSAFPSLNRFQDQKRYMSTEKTDSPAPAAPEAATAAPAADPAAAPQIESDPNKEAPLEIAKKFVTIVNLLSEKNNEKALAAIRETQSHAAFKPEMLIFLVRLLVKRETTAAAKAIQQQMAAEKAKGGDTTPQLSQPQALLLQQNSREKLNRLTELFRSADAMKNAPLLNTMMLAYAGLSDTDSVRAIYDEAMKNGTQPTIATKYIRLQYSKDEAEVESLLAEFSKSLSTAEQKDTEKEKADEALLFSAVLLALSRLRSKADVLKKYYEQMQQKKMKISQHMFGTLIMASRERPEEAFAYFNEAKKIYGKDLSVELYNMALWTCLTTQRITKMEDLVREMKENKVHPNEMTRKLLVVPRGMAKLAKQQTEKRQTQQQPPVKAKPPGVTGIIPKEGLQLKSSAKPSAPSSSSSASSAAPSPAAAAKKPAAAPSPSLAKKPAAAASPKPAPPAPAASSSSSSSSSASVGKKAAAKSAAEPVKKPAAKSAAKKPEKKEKNK